jgi:hypothetical protein
MTFWLKITLLLEIDDLLKIVTPELLKINKINKQLCLFQDNQ